MRIANPPPSSDPPTDSYQWKSLRAEIGEGNPPGEDVKALYASSWFHTVVKPRVLLGRFFAPEEVSWSPKGSPNFVLLNEPYWTRRFQADPAVIGTGLRLDGSYFQILGVVSAPERWDLVELFLPVRADLAPCFPSNNSNSPCS